MNEENHYTAADLPEDLVTEIKLFEAKLKSQADKDVVVIAYEKEKDAPNH
ncbi:hypothetical protein [Peribacillus sp. SCS-155]